MIALGRSGSMAANPSLTVLLPVGYGVGSAVGGYAEVWNTAGAFWSWMTMSE